MAHRNHQGVGAAAEAPLACGGGCVLILRLGKKGTGDEKRMKITQLRREGKSDGHV